jgi:hypothetical protein
MADLILEPSKNSSTKPLGKSFTDSAASMVPGLEMLLKIAAGVGIVVFGIRGIYTSWFPHTLSSVVHTSGNWAEGERRSCTLTTTISWTELSRSARNDPNKSKSSIRVMINQIRTTDCHNIGPAVGEGILLRAANTTNRTEIESNYA